jgi:CheY-like chemotaxis protein
LARKILLADDSVTAQNMGRKILSDAGYEVTAVNNGSAALKKIAEIRPDVVVLDVYMPGYSGLEVCQRLKEAPETARTPVLLTVGKLEPFKPEEAVRVRAEAFIVKPFEASELLSALSKLEDKVVPRSEPTKPGRFARAIAAVEAFDRDRGEAGDANGWKKRINFPRPHSADEKPVDDPALYNPVNRDMRTVVESPAEKSARQRQEEMPVHPAPESVDVTALAPQGLPKDVTPEEVAAIAAAAAQIQAAETDHKTEQSSDSLTAQTPVAEVPAAETVAQSPNVQAEIPQAPAVEVQKQVPAAEPAPSAESSPAHDEPVTMAVAPEAVAAGSNAGSRWTAVSVALEAHEASLSLENEMQKAYAAFAAADAFSALSAATPEVQGVPFEHPHAQEPAEVPAPATADASLAPADLKAPHADAEKAAPVDQQPVIATAPETAAASTATADSVQASAPTAIADSEASQTVTSVPETPATQAVAQTETAEPRVADSQFVSFVRADSAPAPETSFESQSSREDGSGFARGAAVGSDSSTVTNSAASQEKVSGDDTDHTESDRDAQTKSAAEAWASWRQIREVNKESEAVAAQLSQESAGQPSTDTASRAVAAGAGQAGQESSTESTTEAKDVASIVESVLADLRPKLMEEISRKMSKK